MNKTDYLKLVQPQQGAQNWGDSINSNFSAIDAAYHKLQASISSLERVNRQEGYFSFIEGEEYILLNSVKIDKQGTRLIQKNNEGLNKGSTFAIAGSIGQTQLGGNHITYFVPQKIYYFGENFEEINEDDVKASFEKIPPKGTQEFLHCLVYSGAGNKDTYPLYIKTDKGSYAELCNDALLQKEKFIFLDNNTAFYNYLPAETYSETETSSLYKGSYAQHELIIKYVNYGDVTFSSYSNAVGGVYVPQKELNDDTITFTRMPVVNSDRVIKTTLNPYYVYGGIYDVDFSKITKSGDGYSIEIPNSKIVGKSTSNNDKISLQNVSLEFYDKTNGYSKVIVDYKISLGQGNLNLTVYGISETNKNKLLARVTYLSTQITDVLAEQYVQYETIKN